MLLYISDSYITTVYDWCVYTNFLNGGVECMTVFYDSEAMREADRTAINKLGIPGIVLMENAGRGAAELMTRLYPAAGNFIIFCGPGNNGGDGFVVARHLLLTGQRTTVFTTTGPEARSGDAAAAACCAEACGIELRRTGDYSEEELFGLIASADVAVDALLGTGSKGVPRGEAARVIPLLKAARTVVSLDLPSGIDPDTGLSEGVFVTADVTATFLAEKKAFEGEPGKLACGNVFICHIGVPARLLI